MKNAQGVEVNVGDVIMIAAQGRAITAQVVTVDWYEESGWMIEFVSDQVSGNYGYWKQRSDGGQITLVNGGQV